jgi:hypothetical protein
MLAALYDPHFLQWFELNALSHFCRRNGEVLQRLESRVDNLGPLLKVRTWRQRF